MPVFIIAEAGSNWFAGDGDKGFDRAKILIDTAKQSGADAVKFQTFKAKNVYVENAGDSDYLAAAGIKKSIVDIFKDLEMPDDWLPLLADHCRNQEIEFMSSPFSVEDASKLDNLVQRHKLASYEISHLRLIEFQGKSNKPLIVSTGAANEEDIEWFLQTARRNGASDITLLQCVAKYPAPIETLQLRVLPWLASTFNVSVGLSDHSKDPVIGPAGAVAMGATVIEKHFTLDNKLEGPDHSFALEPQQLTWMVDSIRAMEIAIQADTKNALKAFYSIVEEHIGNGRGQDIPPDIAAKPAASAASSIAKLAMGSEKKCIQPEEEELRSFARRGLQAIRRIEKGEIFQEAVNIAILRPGKQNRGIHPKHIMKVHGSHATRVIEAGDGIKKSDFE